MTFRPGRPVVEPDANPAGNADAGSLLLAAFTAGSHGERVLFAGQ